MNLMVWCSFYSSPHPVHILSQSKPAHIFTYFNTSTHWNRWFASELFPAHIKAINFECILSLSHTHCISPNIYTVPEVISRVIFEQEYIFCYWWWEKGRSNDDRRIRAVESGSLIHETLRGKIRQEMYVQSQRWGAFAKPLLPWESNSITRSECVFVTLVIQHAMHTRRILSSSVDCPALQHSCTLSHKRHDFRKKNVVDH